MRTYVRMVVCVHLPRFELVVAAGASQALAGRALAVAPLGGPSSAWGRSPGRRKPSGVQRGMVLGEALARCPELVLLPGDPVKVADAWESALCALESIGAAVESPRFGLAFFEADGLRGLHGSLEQTIAAARDGLARPARIGAAPTRFCALAAALATRSRRPLALDRKRPVGGSPDARSSCSISGRRRRRCSSRSHAWACVRSASWQSSPARS